MEVPQIPDKEIKRRKLFVLITSICAFMLLSTCNGMAFNAEKNNSKPIATVEAGIFVSKLNQQPVFTFGSKVLDTKDISLNKDSFISYSYRGSEGLPEDLIQAALKAQKKGLHLLIELTKEELKNKNLIEMLGKMSQYNLYFRVSLIPGPEVSQKDYDKFYHYLSEQLSDHHVNNVSLIWYPNTLFLEHQEDRNWDQIDGVGINISNPGDMKKLDQVYKAFAGKKEIIINENIIDANSQNLRQGMAFLNEFYYLLAIKYPAVTAVFQSSNLHQADAKYRKAIEDLKQKSWVTNSVPVTTDKPMFETISSNTVLADQVEFLYRPKNDNYQDIAYVDYKFNTETIIQATRSPFVIRLDTNQLHNGINSLKAIVYNKQLKIIEKNQVYFKVENKNVLPRAKRLGKPYSINQKPIYNRSYIPVLMYHDFAAQVPKGKASNTVAASLFEDQIRTLLNHGYTPVTFYDLNQNLNKKAGLPQKPVIITIDDGYLSNYTIAYPLLKKYRIPATFFVTTGFMGTKTQSPHITWAQARDMEESGLIDIQSHTHKHKLVIELKEEEAVYETSISFGLIEKNLGRRDVKVLAYPQFLNTMDSRKWIKGQGIDLQVTNLAGKKSVTSKQNVQRIHVHNKMSPTELIKIIKKLTM